MSVGTIINKVTDGSKAFEAGVRANHLVVALNGERIEHLTKKEFLAKYREAGFPRTLRFCDRSVCT